VSPPSITCLVNGGGTGLFPRESPLALTCKDTRVKAASRRNYSHIRITKTVLTKQPWMVASAPKRLPVPELESIVWEKFIWLNSRKRLTAH